MLSILTTLTIFLVSFVLQLIAVRILRRMHIHTFTSFALYGIGLIIDVLLIMISKEADLPYTSILIYILLTALLATSSFALLLRVRSPSSIIITMLEREKKVTFMQLKEAFDDRQLILRRLNDLVDVGFVQRSGDQYVISAQGILLSHFISSLRVIMGLKI